MTYLTQWDNSLALNGDNDDHARLCHKLNIYSGTIADVGFIFLPLADCHGEGCGIILLYPFLLVGDLVDLPLSMAADTIILPYTISSQMSSDCKTVTPKSSDHSEEVKENPKKVYKAKKSVPPVDAQIIIQPDNQ